MVNQIVSKGDKMKKFLIVVFIVGSISAQSESNSTLDELIVKSKSKTGESFKGKYISSDDTNIYFKPQGSFPGSAQPVEKSTVVLLKLADGTILIDNRMALFASEVEKVENLPSKGHFGGVFIAVGGGLLFSVSGRDCEDCDTIEKANKFADGVKSTSQVGYLLIALGGILVALGI